MARENIKLLKTIRGKTVDEEIIMPLFLKRPKEFHFSYLFPLEQAIAYPCFEEETILRRRLNTK